MSLPFREDATPGLHRESIRAMLSSVLKMLKDDLLQHCKGGSESQAYIAHHGPVRPSLPKNLKPTHARRDVMRRMVERVAT